MRLKTMQCSYNTLKRCGLWVCPRMGNERCNVHIHSPIPRNSRNRIEVWISDLQMLQDRVCWVNSRDWRTTKLLWLQHGEIKAGNKGSIVKVLMTRRGVVGKVEVRWYLRIEGVRDIIDRRQLGNEIRNLRISLERSWSRAGPDRWNEIGTHRSVQAGSHFKRPCAGRKCGSSTDGRDIQWIAVGWQWTTATEILLSWQYHTRGGRWGGKNRSIHSWWILNSRLCKMWALKPVLHIQRTLTSILHLWTLHHYTNWHLRYVNEWYRLFLSLVGNQSCRLRDINGHTTEIAPCRRRSTAIKR